MKLRDGYNSMWALFCAISLAVVIAEPRPGHSASKRAQQPDSRGAFLHTQHAAANALAEAGTASSNNSWRSWFKSGLHREALEVEGSMSMLRDSLLATDHELPPKTRQQMYFRPVSATLQCVMLLTIGSLCMYTSLSISRNVDELGGLFKPSLTTQTLTAASRAGALPPMMCMLFVGHRMYVLATTEGLGEPPYWVKMCMYASSVALICQFLIVLALPAYVKGAEEEASYNVGNVEGAASIQTGDTAVQVSESQAEDADEDVKMLSQETGEQNDAHPNLRDVEFAGEDPSASRKMFFTFQIATVSVLYLGVAGVIVGTFTYPVGTTTVSPAVLCTVVLSVPYFWSYMMLWISRTFYDCHFKRYILNASLSMSSVSRKVPMFAVLFLVSRMRALQLDPPNGMPPRWMQLCYVAITLAVFVEAFMGFLVGTFGSFEKGYYGVYLYHCKRTGDYKNAWDEFTCKHAQKIKHLSALLTYAALIPIGVGVSFMKDQAGKDVPLSTTMNCTLTFVVIYFTNAFLQTCVFFYQDVCIDSDLQTNNQKEHAVMLQDTVVAGGISLGFAPLLCILFVATRMRALQITQQRGDPPGWAQDCMLICVFATCVQSVCCLVMPAFIGKATKVDDEGNPDYDLKPMIGAYAVTVVKFVSLFAIHGGVIAICCANYTMTPETANGDIRFIKGGAQFLEGLGITLLVLLVSLLLSSAKVVGLAVKLAIESVDRLTTGVDIEVTHAALSICKGYVCVRDLIIRNPDHIVIYEKGADGKVRKEILDQKPEWKHEYMFRLKTLLIKIDMWKLMTSLGKVFVIENLDISGIHAYIEKPTADLKKHDSNVEHIIQHMDNLGLVPPPDASAPAPAKEPEAKAPEPEKPSEPAPMPDVKVVLHKIVLGDIGCGMRIDGIPVVGHIQFDPTIGKLHFEDIQRDIFEGKEDPTPTEVIACITKAIVKKVSKKVISEIPTQIAIKTSQATKAIATQSMGLVKHGFSSVKNMFGGKNSSSRTLGSGAQDSTSPKGVTQKEKVEKSSTSTL